MLSIHWALSRCVPFCRATVRSPAPRSSSTVRPIPDINKKFSQFIHRADTNVSFCVSASRVSLLHKWHTTLVYVAPCTKSDTPFSVCRPRPCHGEFDIASLILPPDSSSTPRSTPNCLVLPAALIERCLHRQPSPSSCCRSHLVMWSHACFQGTDL